MRPRLRTLSGTENIAEADYLQASLEIYDFIEANRIDGDLGISYRINPGSAVDYTGGPVHGQYSLYSGSAGTGIFLLRLYEVTGDKKYLEEVSRILDELTNNVSGSDFYLEKLESAPGSSLPITGWHTGVYSGPAGAGVLSLSYYQHEKDAKYLSFAERLGRDILAASKSDENGKYLTEDTDVFSDGGFVLYFISLYRAGGNPEFLEAARDYAAHIAKSASDDGEGGLYFKANEIGKVGMPEGSIYPGFAHGTSGIGFIFATLYEVDGKDWELETAEKTAKFLEKIADDFDGARLIPYIYGGENSDDYKGKYYIGFCHGPAGTSLLFKKLHVITGNSHYFDVYKSLAEGIIKAGAPEYNSWGLWNSYCACCGVPGLIEYFTDVYETTGEEKYLDVARRSAARTIADSFEGKTGRCFYGYWDRTNPFDVQTYTGLYIGAAGAGANLLRLYGHLQGKAVTPLWEYS
ncbi:Lanthionine synthetase C-like protein [Butyrivibrio sp. ob235]|uniref:lanthionine synthetase LanC family protein n=1 Tax=Butyrivibrio sp. ob235 TaxID=1761780 RepID=UPI0008B33BFD|nr:lanthionine synthetase LanC family protein [Butyrivibrio sp. ob235]SEM65056.1 Lanthionine synthetase C-like protein [Butyrivibrio sp. ob235]